MQLSFKFSCKWWFSGFCKLWSRFQMGFSHWWSISKNFTWTCFNLWQECLCLICNGRESSKERERGNYLIEENFDREKFRVFFRFCHFFAMKCFPEKTVYPRRRTAPAEKFAKQTLFLAICKNLYKWISIYCRKYFWKKKKKTNIKETGFYFIMKKHWH